MNYSLCIITYVQKAYENKVFKQRSEEETKENYCNIEKLSRKIIKARKKTYKNAMEQKTAMLKEKG